MPLRGLWLLLSFRWRAPLDVLATSRVQLRVRLRDLDSNLHMNNGRYFSIADFGRFDLGLRSGLWWPALRRGWQPVAGDADARFSRSLQPFQRYELQSRLLGWDEKWFFSEHRFVRDDRVCALVVVRYVLLSKQGPVPPAKVIALAGHRLESPALPNWLLQWHQTQNQISASLKAESSQDH